MDKLEVPVYLITGFLESGKTSFLQEIFESGEFADGERGLLISCEEGEVELDEKATLACKIDTVTLDEEEELTADFLENCKNVYKPKRVLWNTTACGTRIQFLAWICQEDGRFIRL
ncbi:MAG: GTP-binding protein [Coprococcus sp.]